LFRFPADAFGERGPAWSPDGKSILVGWNTMLVRVRLNDLEQTPLGRGDYPAWSSTDRIAFSDGCFGIFAMDESGSNRRVVAGPEYAGCILETLYGHPDWSPGRRLPSRSSGRVSRETGSRWRTRMAAAFDGLARAVSLTGLRTGGKSPSSGCPGPGASQEPGCT
jgi:hypothetical protein